MDFLYPNIQLLCLFYNVFTINYPTLTIDYSLIFKNMFIFISQTSV